MGEMIFGRKMIKANNLYHLVKSKTKADSSKEGAGKEQTVTCSADSRVNHVTW